MGQSIGTLFPFRWRLWLGRKLFNYMGPTTVRVSWHRVIKGPCDPNELEALQYVAKHTSIPVPKVYGVHTDKVQGDMFIEMAYVEGKDFDMAWKRLSVEERRVIFDDLQRYILELRTLVPTKKDCVSSALHNPAYDGRMGDRFFGPFSIKKFHSAIRHHLIEEEIPFFGEEMVQVHLKREYETKFTHGDLCPRNIRIKDGRVAAIIDWGFSGWYPEYWEYTRANFNCFFPGPEEWEEFTQRALPGYDTELTAERVLWRQLPEPASEFYTSGGDGLESHHPGTFPEQDWLKSRPKDKLNDLWTLVLKKLYKDKIDI